jgi:hypothetical protein
MQFNFNPLSENPTTRLFRKKTELFRYSTLTLFDFFCDYSCLKIRKCEKYYTFSPDSCSDRKSKKELKLLFKKSNGLVLQRALYELT